MACAQEAAAAGRTLSLFGWDSGQTDTLAAGWEVAGPPRRQALVLILSTAPEASPLPFPGEKPRLGPGLSQSPGRLVEMALDPGPWTPRSSGSGPAAPAREPRAGLQKDTQDWPRAPVGARVPGGRT